MCKLIKLVSGCETFSVLSPIKTEGKHLSIDMEALVGEPINKELDQEVVLLLHQYNFSDLRGPNRDYLLNLRHGRAKLHRQTVENEDYAKKIPQLQRMVESKGQEQRLGKRKVSWKRSLVETKQQRIEILSLNYNFIAEKT